MHWFKMDANYDSDLAIATADDAGEVMWTRGLAYCRRARSGGFIPAGELHKLTRHPARAKRIAAQLTRDKPDGSAGPWEQVEGGYRVRNWDSYQDAFEELEQRRRSDRERKRSQRARDRRDTSRDVSRDSPVDVTPPEQREEADAAAAAPATPTNGLPPAVEILRSALEAHKLTVRWDTLTTEQISEVEQLVATHGDAALVQAALRAYQPNKPPVYATAWLAGWRHLRQPGRLAAVPAEPCPEPGHSGTVRHCAQCASEQKAAR